MPSYSKRLSSLLITHIANQHSWSRTWMRDPAVNVASKKRFRGVNRLTLTLVSSSNRWSGNTWGTAAQWQKKGFTVLRDLIPTQVVCMVEATERDELWIEYGAKRISFCKHIDEFCGVQVGDDDSWSPRRPNLDGVMELVMSVFGERHLAAVPSAEDIRGSDAVTPLERRTSHLVRAALRYTIETEMLHLLSEPHQSPDLITLAAEIGTAYILQDVGMVPDRIRDPDAVRRWSAMLIADPNLSVYAAGLAQHTIDRMAEAAGRTEAAACGIAA